MPDKITVYKRKENNLTGSSWIVKVKNHEVRVCANTALMTLLCNHLDNSTEKELKKLYSLGVSYCQDQHNTPEKIKNCEDIGMDCFPPCCTLQIKCGKECKDFLEHAELKYQQWIKDFEESMKDQPKEKQEKKEETKYPNFLSKAG